MKRSLLCVHDVGDVISIHAESNELRRSPDKEELIVKCLNHLQAVESHKILAALASLSDNDKQSIAVLLQNLGAAVVGAKVTESVLMFLHCETVEIFDHVWTLFKSGELVRIIQQLFRILANNDLIFLKISITDENGELCRDGFAVDGMYAVTVIFVAC